MFSYLYRILSGLATLVCTAIAFIPFFMGTSTYKDFLKKSTSRMDNLSSSVSLFL